MHEQMICNLSNIINICIQIKTYLNFFWRNMYLTFFKRHFYITIVIAQLKTYTKFKKYIFNSFDKRLDIY